ncbi:MAG: glycosyltransferase, partial [Akkermansiaceae bacterium]|nr:glycosyltransferase [Akkermansiaceae bacterium]
MLEELIAQARSDIDPADPAHRERVGQLVTAILGEDDSAAVSARLHREGTPLEARLAGLLARSRREILACREPLRVGVVFAMWGEHNRLRPRSPDNPHGEDSLALKLEQLAEATRDSVVSWHLYAVDDGCPHDSAGIARKIAAAHPLGGRVTVLSLAEALPAADGPLARLATAGDSRKAGAIILGAMQAIAAGVDAVIYTDADNSVHLGQIGLLLQPFVEHGVPVVLGNRKHPDSVLVKEGARWGIGIKVLRHMQRMIGHAV